MNAACPSWCEKGDHPRDDIHGRSIAAGPGPGRNNAGRVGVAIGQGKYAPPAVYLQLFPRPGEHVTVTFDAGQAAAVAPALSALAAPKWVKKALAEAAALIVAEEAAAAATAANQARTPVTG